MTTQADYQRSFRGRVPAAAVRERDQGCLLGGAVGDALGAPVEFLQRSEILSRFGALGVRDIVPAYGRTGAITDDTQMTLFTAEGVLRAYVRGAVRGLCHPPSVIHYAYLRWLYTQDQTLSDGGRTSLNGWLIQQPELFAQRAPGVTCLDALRQNSVIGNPTHNDSKGCGGVMRVAPIGMFFHSLARSQPETRDEQLERAFALACDAAALTHGHPTGSLTAGVMASLVFELLDGVSLVEAIGRVTPLLRRRDRHEGTLSAITAAVALSASDTDPTQAISQLGEGWVAEEALAIGLYCALTAADFESAVVVAINHDGDSDSTGLIAGHLVGAIEGRSAIPQRWLAPLELRSVIEEVADDLATVAEWQLVATEDPAEKCEASYYWERYPGG